MRRREVLLLGTAAAATAPLVAVRAQPDPAKVYRIGYIATGSTPARSESFIAFERRLGKLGYINGRNLAIEYRGHEGHPERLPGLAAELVRLNSDVIVANGPEAVLNAAAAAAAATPIVAVAVDYDPQGRGYVASLRRPGGNVTGVFFRQAEVTAKRLELLKEAVPALTRVAVFVDAFTTDTSEQMRAAESIAAQLALHLDPIELRRVPADFALAVANAGERGAGAVLALMSPALFLHRKALVEAMSRGRMPASFGLREFAEAGGLMSYGANLAEMAARAADYVDRVLKGARPGELPVEQPTKFELVINLKTARELGLELPRSLLLRADEVIE